jgi:hypothetical protein
VFTPDSDFRVYRRHGNKLIPAAHAGVKHGSLRSEPHTGIIVVGAVGIATPIVVDFVAPIHH